MDRAPSAILNLVVLISASCEPGSANPVVHELAEGLEEITFRYKPHDEVAEVWQITSRQPYDLEAFKAAVTDQKVHVERDQGLYEMIQEIWLDLKYEDGTKRVLVSWPHDLNSWFYEEGFSTVDIEGEPMGTFANRFIVSRGDFIEPVRTVDGQPD